MERLTYWKDGNAFLQKNESTCHLSIHMKEICRWCRPGCGLKSNECVLGNAIRKLTEYEDLIEQGKLVELVRCGECKHRYTKHCAMGMDERNILDDDYCSNGERRE